MHLRPLLTVAALALVAPALSAQSSTLLEDTFADGDRTTQNLPASLAWYAPGAAVSTISVRNNSLTLVANDNDRLLWGYLPAQSLAVGDSLVVTVDFSFSRLHPAAAGAFKIALCSTHGVAPKRADGGPPTGGYQGYASFTNPGDATAGTRLRKRSGPAAGNSTATILELTDGATDVVWATFGANRTGLAGALQANTPYTKTLRITRTGVDAARVTTTISGGTLAANNTLSETDTAGIVTSFDTVAIGAAETVQAGDLTIRRIQIVHELNTSRLTNLSILTSISSNGDFFTMGYVVGGSGTTGDKPLVIRAAGPSLGALGVPGTLDDPKLELFAGNGLAGVNDNWNGEASLRDAMAAVGAFAYAAPTSRDAAIATRVSTADNSVRVSAAGDGSGTVIAELYDATPDASFTKSTRRLINVSVLKSIGDKLTAGFVIGGSGSKTVLIRAIGPTLGSLFNVQGAIADPRLDLFSGQTRIGQNDNWGGTELLTSAFTSVSAFGLPSASRDAALLVTLDPGNYSVEVTPATGGTGSALVEVYEVP